MRTSGFTLAELLIVAVVVGVLASLAAPKLSEYLALHRRQGTLNRFAGELYRARMDALRRGRSLEIVLENSGQCPAVAHGVVADGWRVRDPLDGRTLRSTALADGGPGLCLHSSGDASILVTARGLPGPFENRTLWVAHGDRADTLVVSVLGRVLRRF